MFSAAAPAAVAIFTAAAAAVRASAWNGGLQFPAATVAAAAAAAALRGGARAAMVRLRGTFVGAATAAAVGRGAAAGGDGVARLPLPRRVTAVEGLGTLGATVAAVPTPPFCCCFGAAATPAFALALGLVLPPCARAIRVAPVFGR